MSRNTLRIIIVLAAVSIAGITFTQVYWVRKAFDIRENQFSRDVHTALHNVAGKIFEINHAPSPVNNPVSQLTTNYFVVLVNGPIDASVLEFLLVSEFEKRNITADFEYGIYDCVEKCMVGGNYISPKKVSVVSSFPETPRLNNDGYYFAVQFPGLEANLLSQMGIWGFSSAVLLVVIFFFIYTLLVILKQRRLSEVQKDFINNMTHEFKTPIATISLAVDSIKDPRVSSQPEKLEYFSRIIREENKRMNKQVEHVLQMAQLEKGELSLRRETVDLHDTIRQAVDSIGMQVASRGGKIETRMEALHPAVTGDPVHLMNVVLNLLDNANKYSPEAPDILIASNDHPGGILISVRDQGMGMTKETQKRIFEKFYRVPTGNIHDIKGFGLGLSYVKAIVEKHRGWIRLDSDPGKGSTFEIYIPHS